MASFLYCFPCSYRSSNYCNSNSCRSFTLLKALAKSNGNLFATVFKWRERATNIIFAIVGRAITLEREPSKIKQRSDTKRMQRRLRVIEKSSILLSQYWKFKCIDGTIIISYFGGSNNNFADCRFILVQLQIIYSICGQGNNLHISMYNS